MWSMEKMSPSSLKYTSSEHVLLCPNLQKINRNVKLPSNLLTAKIKEKRDIKFTLLTPAISLLCKRKQKSEDVCPNGNGSEFDER